MRTSPPDLVERLQAVLRQGPPVRLAVLFGSTVRGGTRPDSDVDVAILPAGAGLDDEDELALARELTLAARAEVDLVRLDTASTLLKWQVATTGVPLTEISPGEFAKFQARAASEYIEFAPAFAYNGEIFRRRLVEQGKGAPPDSSGE